MCSQQTFARHITTAWCHHASRPPARLQFLPQKTQRPQLITSDVPALLKCKLLGGVRIHRANCASKERKCAPSLRPREHEQNINSTQKSYFQVMLLKLPVITTFTQAKVTSILLNPRKFHGAPRHTIWKLHFWVTSPNRNAKVYDHGTWVNVYSNRDILYLTGKRKIMKIFKDKMKYCFENKTSSI